MKNIIRILLITGILLSGSLYGMKRANTALTPCNQEQENHMQQPLWLPEEVIIRIAAHSVLQEKNTLNQLSKSFWQCLKRGKDLIIGINPWTVSLKDLSKTLFKAVCTDGAYPNGAREDKYYLVERILDTKLSKVINNCPFWFIPRNILQKTPLHYASDKKNEAMEKLLVKYGVENGIPCPKVNSLHEAVYQGNKEEVLKLLAEGSNPNLALTNDITPLYIAAHEGHVEIVQLLLDHKAYADPVAIGLDTPLYIASREGHIDVVELLLNHNADVNRGDLNNIIAFDGRIEVVRLLLSHGAKLNRKYSPLLSAIKNKNAEMVKLLLDYGADVNQADLFGYTPLIEASLNGHTEIVQLLLNHNANIHQKINSVDVILISSFYEGETALQIAQRKGHMQIAKLLQNQIDRDKIKNRI